MATTDLEEVEFPPEGPAEKRTLDFRYCGLGVKDDEIPRHPVSGFPLALNGKQNRRRAFRQAKRVAKEQNRKVLWRHLGDSEAREMVELGYKPISDWDDEELARGRPRAIDGTFRGKSPSWVSREMHETAVESFKDLVRSKMRVNVVDAVHYLGQVIGDDRLDEKGRPVVPASTKADAAKFLVEHLLGKPKQEIREDINVRLQAVLASATVQVPDGTDLRAGAGGLPAGLPRPEPSRFGEGAVTPSQLPYAGTGRAPLPPEALEDLAASGGIPRTGPQTWIDGEAWEEDADEEEEG